MQNILFPLAHLTSSKAKKRIGETNLSAMEECGCADLNLILQRLIARQY